MSDICKMSASDMLRFYISARKDTKYQKVNI